MIEDAKVAESPVILSKKLDNSCAARERREKYEQDISDLKLMVRPLW